VVDPHDYILFADIEHIDGEAHPMSVHGGTGIDDERGARGEGLAAHQTEQALEVRACCCGSFSNYRFIRSVTDYYRHFSPESRTYNHVPG